MRSGFCHTGRKRIESLHSFIQNCLKWLQYNYVFVCFVNYSFLADLFECWTAFCFFIELFLWMQKMLYRISQTSTMWNTWKYIRSRSSLLTCLCNINAGFLLWWKYYWPLEWTDLSLLCYLSQETRTLFLPPIRSSNYCNGRLLMSFVLVNCHLNCWRSFNNQRVERFLLLVVFEKNQLVRAL